MRKLYKNTTVSPTIIDREYARLRYLAFPETRKAINKKWADSNKEQVKTNHKHWGQSKRGRERQAIHRRKSRYGITEETFKKLWNSQDGKCLICQNTRKLGVDHNHKNKKIRALLCTPCNSALGLFEEKEASLKAAIEYLKTYDSMD